MRSRDPQTSEPTAATKTAWIIGKTTRSRKLEMVGGPVGPKAREDLPDPEGSQRERSLDARPQHPAAVQLVAEAPLHLAARRLVETRAVLDERDLVAADERDVVAHLGLAGEAGQLRLRAAVIPEGVGLG